MCRPRRYESTVISKSFALGVEEKDLEELRTQKTPTRQAGRSVFKNDLLKDSSSHGHELCMRLAGSSINCLLSNGSGRRPDLPTSGKLKDFLPRNHVCEDGLLFKLLQLQQMENSASFDVVNFLDN